MFNLANPYVYLGVHKTTRKFYIGARYSSCRNHLSPDQDLGTLYFTTSKVVKPIFNEFNWTILAQFITKEDALEFEGALITEHWNNPLLLNKNKGGKKFYRPDNYIRKPKNQVKKGRSQTMKDLWKDPNSDLTNSTVDKKLILLKNLRKHILLL